MEFSQSYAILGLDLSGEFDAAELLDRFEEAVFKESTFFIRRAFIPKLALKRVERLEAIKEAGLALNINFENEFTKREKREKFHKTEGLIPLLFDYHNHESILKTILANAANPSVAIDIYKEWIELFTCFSKYYIEIFDGLDCPNQTSALDIKISDSVDFNDLLQELKNNKYDGLVLREYNRLKKMMA